MRGVFQRLWVPELKNAGEEGKEDLLARSTLDGVQVCRRVEIVDWGGGGLEVRNEDEKRGQGFQEQEGTKGTRTATGRVQASECHTVLATGPWDWSGGTGAWVLVLVHCRGRLIACFSFLFASSP